MAIAALPLIFSAAGAAAQGVQQANASAYNSAIYAQEGRTAAIQGAAAEANLRRNNAQTMGRMVAGAAQAGGGFNGSVGRSIQQSANNMELDALNIRYKSQLQKWAYGAQSSNLAQEGSSAMSTSLLRAGASLLKGYNTNYLNPQTDLG